MIFLGLCLLGVLSLARLPVQLLPDIDFPSLTVVTPYEGAPPSEIEQLVTRRVEEAAGSVSGVREIRSESLEGLSLVTLRFNWKTDMDFSLIETREKVDMIKGELPENAGRSIVVKYDPAQDPMIICAVEAVNGDFKKLRKRVEREIIPRLERADGTAHIDLNGGFRRQINVHLDTGSLYARGISIAEIVDAVGSANFNFPAGTLVKGSKEYAVRTIGEFASVDDIGRVVVARTEGGAPVYLEDAGEIEDGYREQKCLIRLDGKDALGLLIYKEPGKNTIAACEAAREMIAGLSEKYGGELSMRVIYDQSVFVNNAVNNVLMAALLGGLFAVLTLWFFLGDSRSALIIAASIPISVLGSFALMHFSGLSINVMSLGGLALGTGMLVDAGIVVLESIARKKQEAGSTAGPGLIRLIAEGVREVRTPVIASTATTLVVFLPILFISGVAGALFGQLALTISFSLICSLLTSLALIPMLSGLPDSKKSVTTPGFATRGHAFMVKAVDNLLERISSAYRLILLRAFDNPKAVLLTGALMILLGTGATALLDRELMPGVDSGEFTLEVNSSPGTPLVEQARLCAALEAAIARSPHVRHVYAKIGSDPDENISERLLGKQSNYAKIRVILKNGPRPHIRDIIANLKESVRAGELVRLDFRVREDVVESVISSGAAPLSIELRDNDMEKLRAAGDALKKTLGALNGIRNISSGLDRGGPELKLIIDRARMQSLEVDAAAVASSVRAAVHGETATAFRQGDDETDVLVRLRESDRSGIDSLNGVMVKSRGGVLLPVGKFCVHRGRIRRRQDHAKQPEPGQHHLGRHRGLPEGRSGERRRSAGGFYPGGVRGRTDGGRFYRACENHSGNGLRGPPGHRAGLHGAGLPVPVDAEPARHHVLHSADPSRQFRGAPGGGQNAQHQLRHRHHPSLRNGGEQCHRAGGLRGPYARRRARSPLRAPPGLRQEASPHHDDHPHHHPRDAAHRPGRRPGLGNTTAAGNRGHRRPPDLHVSHSALHPVDLFADPRRPGSGEMIPC